MALTAMPRPKERGLSSQVNNGRFQSKTTGPTIDNPLDLTKRPARTCSEVVGLIAPGGLPKVRQWDRQADVKDQWRRDGLEHEWQHWTDPR